VRRCARLLQRRRCVPRISAWCVLYAVTRLLFVQVVNTPCAFAVSYDPVAVSFSMCVVHSSLLRGISACACPIDDIGGGYC
jgi:hypothetical protein